MIVVYREVLFELASVSSTYGTTVVLCLFHFFVSFKGETVPSHQGVVSAPPGVCFVVSPLCCPGFLKVCSIPRLITRKNLITYGHAATFLEGHSYYL